MYNNIILTILYTSFNNSFQHIINVMIIIHTIYYYVIHLGYITHQQLFNIYVIFNCGVKCSIHFVKSISIVPGSGYISLYIFIPSFPRVLRDMAILIVSVFLSFPYQIFQNVVRNLSSFHLCHLSRSPSLEHY